MVWCINLPKTYSRCQIPYHYICDFPLMVSSWSYNNPTHIYPLALKYFEKMIQNGLLYNLSFVSMALFECKIGAIYCKAHFSHRSYYGDLESSNFWNPFQALNDHFCVKSLWKSFHQPSQSILIIEIITMVQRLPQSKSLWRS